MTLISIFTSFLGRFLLRKSLTRFRLTLVDSVKMSLRYESFNCGSQLEDDPSSATCWEIRWAKFDSALVNRHFNWVLCTRSYFRILTMSSSCSVCLRAQSFRNFCLRYLSRRFFGQVLNWQTKSRRDLNKLADTHLRLLPKSEIIDFLSLLY